MLLLRQERQTHTPTTPSSPCRGGSTNSQGVPSLRARPGPRDPLPTALRQPDAITAGDPGSRLCGPLSAEATISCFVSPMAAMIGVFPKSLPSAHCVPGSAEDTKEVNGIVPVVRGFQSSWETGQIS